MKFPLVFAGILAWLGAVLFLTAGQAHAQNTGTVTPGTERAAPQAKEEPPPGGCMPIGVTASGEIVFPFLCKGFIEQHKAANQKPTGSDDAIQKPIAADTQSKSADEKSAAKQPDNVAPRTAEPAPDALTQGSSPIPAAAEEQHPKGDAKAESAEDKSAATSPENTASITRSAPEPAEPAASPERERKKPREGSAGPPGCTHFKSYEASSATYTDYSGRRRACRS
jgi:hypothetical protein